MKNNRILVLLYIGMAILPMGIGLCWDPSDGDVGQCSRMGTGMRVNFIIEGWRGGDGKTLPTPPPPRPRYIYIIFLVEISKILFQWFYG